MWDFLSVSKCSTRIKEHLETDKYLQKYNTLKTDTLRKYEKLKIKIRKAELGLTFLTNCQTLNFYPKFLTFNLPNEIYKETAITQCNQEKKKRVTIT